ncbi:hypothetical protein EI94DRAFT_1801722 [Lactarius quietus]|nr:hypothetical protein EI94DRAFT_1801722 [Lactarius quietus]
MDAERMTFRCMEHSLHLVAKHFIKTIAPCSRKRGPSGGSASDSDNDPASDSDQDDNEDDEDIPVGDSLGKAIALVKQIHKLLQAWVFFHMMCTQVNITPLELLLWICTHWGSLFTFLECFIHLKLAVNQFILLTDENKSVPPLTKKCHYINFHLSSKDWEYLSLIRDALREPFNAQQTFSSKRTPTVWHIIPSFEFLIKHWDSMACEPKYQGLKDTLNEGTKNLHKWYGWVGSTSSGYFICLVLDPNVKDLYFRHQWESDQYTAGMQQLEDVFDSYYITPTQSATTIKDSTDGPSMLKPLFHYGGTFLLSAIQAIQQQGGTFKGPHCYVQAAREPDLGNVE